RAPPGHLGQRRQADVRQAQIGRQHGARDVDALEALLLDEPCGQRVERAGEAQQLPRREPLAEQPPLLVRRGGRIQHQNSPSGASGADASTPAFAMMDSSPTSAAVSSGSLWTSSRKRSISSTSSTGWARMRNLRMYCSRPNGRAPRGCASATAGSSTSVAPSVRVISTRPPKALSAGSVEW